MSEPRDSPDRWERDTIIRLGARFEGLQGEVRRHSEEDEDAFRRIETSIKELRTEMGSKYVTKADFSPTRLIAYGLVGVIVMSVVTALVSLVVIGKVHTP
jgi:hypothetical protein